MRRSLLLLGTLIALALALLACGGGGGEGDGVAKPIEIEVWHSEPAANLDTLERMADRFNASQGDVQVRMVYQGSAGDVMTKLLTVIGSDEVPDVAFLVETYVQMMIDSGVTVPAQDFIDRDGYDLSDLDPKAVQAHTVEDHLWAMPICVDTPVLYYNKTAYREAGLDPERTPQDLEELRTFSQIILDASDGDRAGIALDIKLWFEGALAQQGDLLVNEENGHTGRATEALFDSKAGRYIFTWWHDMVDDGLALNMGRNSTGADSYLAVSTDRAAMTFGYAGALRSLVDALEQSGENLEFGLGALPGPPGGTGSSLLLPHALWVLDKGSDAVQEAAWTFVRWMLEPEQQAEWFAGSGCLPVSRSSVQQPLAQQTLEQFPLFQDVLDLYLDAPADPAVTAALLGPLQEIRQAITDGLERMLTTGTSPDHALEDAAGRANDAIDEYNERIGE